MDIKAISSHNMGFQAKVNLKKADVKKLTKEAVGAGLISAGCGSLVSGPAAVVLQTTADAQNQINGYGVASLDNSALTQSVLNTLVSDFNKGYYDLNGDWHGPFTWESFIPVALFSSGFISVKKGADIRDSANNDEKKISDKVNDKDRKIPS